MCGLFGLARAATAEHPEWASDAFVALGFLAEERGVDSAGVALFGRPGATNVVTPTIQGDITDGGCRLVKGQGRFTDVWRPDLLPELDLAPVALGHTRWATQGTPEHLVNAGPLLVGDLVGTHNGDVEAARLRDRFALPPAIGGTDSEVIYQALAAGHRPETVLSALHGRAALAWVDRTRPERLHLARGALSPLCVAVDEEGNVYWASNPGWFRTVAQVTRVRFRSAVLVREGTYLTVEAGVMRDASFVPTARPSDLLLIDKVWVGFTAADRGRDFAQRRHQVTQTCVA
jgi:glucosamine 6-phosphate synthetase-like amidotransferase/phosphosugar isomerase protein